jgi:CheY-like chemotaxis protein
LGFEVQAAANGQEAIEIWERWKPHLIWMDMRMPVMDGCEATRWIKTTPEGQATIVVALTATAFEEDRERILLEGCDDFVRKPFHKNEIYDILAKHLGVRFLYEEAPELPDVTPSTFAGALPDDTVTTEKLSSLPASWVADLEQATIKADLHLILTLVDQIRGHDAALADALAVLAQDFEYKKILTLVGRAGGDR